MAMRLLDLFSGIGGFSYAAETLIGGYETVAFCEMDEFCQKVLKKHWPQVPIFDDVRTLDAARLGRIDIVTGGYPCQPFSQAGRRQGEEDERHLWPEMLRIIKSCQPRYVVAENVAGHVTMGLDQVLTDLEDQGYTTRPIIVPACAKNAPHRRDRVWIIGQLMADTYKWQSRSGDESKSNETQQFKFSTDNTSERGIVANSENNRGEQTEWKRGGRC
jgi:DNA (cytosine-5)-methyltransferase 1